MNRNFVVGSCWGNIDDVSLFGYLSIQILNKKQLFFYTDLYYFHTLACRTDKNSTYCHFPYPPSTASRQSPVLTPTLVRIHTTLFALSISLRNKLHGSDQRVTQDHQKNADDRIFKSLLSVLIHTFVGTSENHHQSWDDKSYRSHRSDKKGCRKK